MLHEYVTGFWGYILSNWYACVYVFCQFVLFVFVIDIRLKFLDDSCEFVWGHWSSLDAVMWSLGLHPKSQYWILLWILHFFLLCCWFTNVNDIRKTKQGLSTFCLPGKLDLWEEQMGRSLFQGKLEQLPISSVGDRVWHSALWQDKSFCMVLKGWDGRNNRNSGFLFLHLFWPKVLNFPAGLWFVP